VNTLGELLPVGRLLTLVSFLKITEEAHVLLHSKNCVIILTKDGWDTFGGIFSQHHPVTLISSKILLKDGAV
jgi:hypothetical protein